jgi:hypothetical protein
VVDHFASLLQGKIEIKNPRLFQGGGYFSLRYFDITNLELLTLSVKVSKNLKLSDFSSLNAQIVPT